MYMIQQLRGTAAASLLLLAACGADASGSQAAPPTPSIVAVRTALVHDAMAAQPIRATGTVSPEEEVKLAFKTGGVIAAVAVEEGQQVRRGQLLATLDQREVSAGVSKARSALAKAERDLARARALYRDSVATLEQLQDATTATEVARADLASASFNQRYAAIVAPANGTILRRMAEAGENVVPGATVLELGVAASGVVLRVGLADRDAVRVREGDQATLQFDALPGRVFAGRVARIAPAAESRTGTYEAEIGIGPEARELFTGLIGRAEIRPSRTERVRLVPAEAIMEADGDHAVVYALTPDGKRARRVPVGIGFLQGDRVAIHSGLEGVGAVVTDGVAYLSDGAAVRRVQ